MKQVLIAVLLLIALASFVLAAKGTESATQQNTTKNMTFGQCVSDGAAVKNTCYSTAKDTRTSCMANARNQTDAKSAARSCKQAYDAQMKTCKAGFKQAKKECSKIKHGWLEGATASFK
jgi:hypothetical protein